MFLKLSLEGLSNDTQLHYRGRIDKSIDETIGKILSTIELFEKRKFPDKDYTYQAQF